MTSEIRPIFLFNVSRTGSTLVQRVLGSYPEIATHSEPWLLMPVVSALNEDIPGPADWHHLVHTAIEDFCQHLPGGEQEYLDEYRAYILRLYARAAGPGKRYYLDKTPGYFSIVEDVIRLFPEGRFVFLWRNPLSTIASMVETWEQGRWNMHRRRRDLLHGLPNIISAYQRHQDHSVAVRYEDLVLEPEAAWPAVMRYLDMEFDPASLTEFSRVSLTGRMGDPTGSRRYGHVSREPLEKWRQTICNPVRRMWCERYLRWLGRERLEVMGYSLDELLADLASVGRGSDRLGGDVRELGVSLVREVVAARSQKRGVPSAWRMLLDG